MFWVGLGEEEIFWGYSTNVQCQLDLKNFDFLEDATTKTF